ncbi:MAG: hypothetical protein EA382_06405 [Spirochaetaceae bacterium]|nr:MAG: hypothetical protein EA382_06405 [Spirochaetaceae bacterium]
MHHEQPHWLTYVALITAVVGWGSSFVATKVALETLRPATLIFFRLAFAAGFFAVLLHARRSKPGMRGARAPLREFIPRLVLLSLFEPIAYFLLETEGIARTSASSASLVVASIPVLVAIVARIVLHERLDSRGWAGTLVSLAGVVLLVVGDNNPDYADSSLVGNLLVFGAALSAAGYIVTARSLSGRVDPVSMTFVQMVTGALFFLPLFAANMIRFGAPEITPRVAVAFGFLALAATVVAFLSYNYALSRIPAGKAAVFINGIPLVTVIVASVLIAETLSAVQAIAGIVIVGGVALTTIRSRSAAAESR